MGIDPADRDYTQPYWLCCGLLDMSHTDDKEIERGIPSAPAHTPHTHQCTKTTRFPSGLRLAKLRKASNQHSQFEVECQTFPGGRQTNLNKCIFIDTNRLWFIGGFESRVIEFSILNDPKTWETGIK